MPCLCFAWQDGSHERAAQRFAEVMASIGKSDYADAEKQVRDVINESVFVFTDYEPFTGFLSEGTPQDDPEYAARLDRWLQLKPRSAIALLLRAHYEYRHGWRIRGEDYAARVPYEKMKQFMNLMRRARDDVALSLSLEELTPYARLLQLHIDRGGPEAAPVFEESVRRYPGYYALYAERLLGLTPRWGGSTQEMVDFTKRFVNGAPEGSVLRLLPIALYKQLVLDMEFNCITYPPDKRPNCVLRKQAILSGTQMENWLKQAFALYARSDKTAYSRVVILSLLNSKALFHPPYDRIIYLGREALSENFAFNLNYANYYSGIGSYGQAAGYYTKSLDEMATFPFSSEAERTGWKNEVEALRAHAYAMVGAH